MKIIKNSYIWFTISLLLILFSFGAIIATKLQTGSLLRYGIDFTGGTLMEVLVEKEEIGIEDAREALSLYKDFSPSVQETEKGAFIIKMKNLSNEEHDKIILTLKEKLGELEETRFITIGPSIGETLKEKAVFAIVIAIIAIVFYIAFAFRESQKRLSSWKFGVSAIIALIHDVIITVGVFTFLGFFLNAEVDALLITALLTILGFSVHDTIVTFDRVRENFKFARPSETFEEIAENAVKQTMKRSINTSLSTLFPLITLYLFGADNIKMFVLILIFGVIVGTYSSIFIATAILVKWEGGDKVIR